MFNNPVIKEEGYTIVITKEHLAGDKQIDSDCPGFRAFKDALPSKVYFNIPTEPVNCRNWGLANNRTQWGISNKHLWTSYKKNSNGELVKFIMTTAKIGDEIILKKSTLI